ncbi:MAG: hypothetical protein KC636_29850, partial [Myxococcales bacterium]|nr:hypothetical protein [Myxococcales bacterium]
MTLSTGGDDGRGDPAAGDARRSAPRGLPCAGDGVRGLRTDGGRTPTDEAGDPSTTGGAVLGGLSTEGGVTRARPDDSFAPSTTG